MLQLVIWGLCIMLIVKALDMLQRQSLAKHPETGASILTISGVAIAILGAALLFFVGNSQAELAPNSSPFSYDGRGAAERALDEASPEDIAKACVELNYDADQCARLMDRN